MIRQRDLPLDTHYGGGGGGSGTCVTLRHLGRPPYHVRTRAYSLKLYIIKYTRMGIGSKDKWTVISDDECKGTGSKGGQTLSGFRNCLRLIFFSRGASVRLRVKQLTKNRYRARLRNQSLLFISTITQKMLKNTY